jgi:2-polyprenyl-6-hydroxyphenyl methylase/3-demethylubiquinone-9 3-methyltransferase
MPIERSTAASDRPDTRFAFGRNWQRFSRYVDEERLTEAAKSLCEMLELGDLAGRSFLDIGCGSGLFSLAAMRLGARTVHSFDYDRQSVSCAQELKRLYYDQAPNWTIERGDMLDPAYLSRLSAFDVVYSWGVAHHTGNMWQALENVGAPVRPGGKLYLALYNDQGRRSRAWRAVKERYSRSWAWRLPIVAFFGSYFVLGGFAGDLVRLRNPLARYRRYKKSRGMSYLTDLLDWLGGYPFEVAKPDAVLQFFHARGFETAKLTSVGAGRGNNEFVFVKITPADLQ